VFAGESVIQRGSNESCYAPSFARSCSKLNRSCSKLDVSIGATAAQVLDALRKHTHPMARPRPSRVGAHWGAHLCSRRAPICLSNALSAQSDMLLSKVQNPFCCSRLRFPQWLSGTPVATSAPADNEVELFSTRSTIESNDDDGRGGPVVRGSRCERKRHLCPPNQSRFDCGLCRVCRRRCTLCKSTPPHPALPAKKPPEDWLPVEVGGAG